VTYPGLTKLGGDEVLFKSEVQGNFKNWENYYDKRQSAILEGSPDLFHRNDRLKDFRNLADWLGLKPEHRVLDYGCATIGLGEYLIRFLNPQCYVGIDVSKIAIELGRKRIRDTDLYERGPILLHLENGQFPTETLLHFDYAFASSVFTHCPPKTIISIIKYVKEKLLPGGRFSADICIANNNIIFQGYHNFYYTKDFVDFICGKMKLVYELVPDPYIEKIDPRALGKYYKLMITG
jgi:cyclopropane fatty-acyl-phospholipid synthase-like methyltransferase